MVRHNFIEAAIGPQASRQKETTSLETPFEVTLLVASKSTSTLIKDPSRTNTFAPLYRKGHKAEKLVEVFIDHAWRHFLFCL